MAVMRLPTIDPELFVRLVQPPLEAKDLEGLLALLKARWTPDQIAAVLSCDRTDARKVAALSLSLVGGKCCLDALLKTLKDPDPVINELAEHALWSIWFRLGTEEANQELARGSRALNDRDFETAERHFARAIEFDEDFAEAYNQRAIGRYLQERYEESIADCLHAVRLMPCHFGAWAGMGHCHAHLGQLAEAIDSYQRAMEINPHLDCVREAIRELRRRVG